MSDLSNIGAAFNALGGLIIGSSQRLAERALGCRGLVLDWDGVFNAGTKGEGAASTFNEADSMGLNLLRYSMWRRQRVMPVAAIITGEQNETAKVFGAREHFDVVYTGVKRKERALDALCAAYGVQPDELLLMFDDVNDLGMAARCGLRVLVRRNGSPLLREYAVRHGLVDYVTGAHAHEHAVREAAELVLGVTNAFDAVVRSRVAWDADYAAYFDARQSVETRFEPEP